MSLSAIHWVARSSRSKGAARLVLLALADILPEDPVANDDAGPYYSDWLVIGPERPAEPDPRSASISDIALWANITHRQVSTSLLALVTLGDLEAFDCNDFSCTTYSFARFDRNRGRRHSPASAQPAAGILLAFPELKEKEGA